MGHVQDTPLPVDTVVSKTLASKSIHPRILQIYSAMRGNLNRRTDHIRPGHFSAFEGLRNEVAILTLGSPRSSSRSSSDWFDDVV